MDVTTVQVSAAMEAGTLSPEFWMTHCHDCRAEFQKTPTTPGYAVDHERDVRICYDCADKHQVENLLTATVVGAYVSSTGRWITTWTGGELMTVTSESHSDTGAFGGISYYRATDMHHQHWYGKGSGRDMYITMRKTKHR